MTLNHCHRCGAQYLNMPYALCIPCWREMGVREAITEESDSVAGLAEIASQAVHGERVEVEKRWRVS